MLQTSLKRMEARYSDIGGQWATKRRNRKVTANNRRACTKSEEDGSRSHGEDGAQGACEDNADMLISFEKVLSRGSIHTAECCRLSLPRAFCERYEVGGNVTATDSAGTRLWHMRFQSCRARHSVYTISNGWREFSYDHGLKVRDRLVFTLLSASHFRVEFAALSRRMLATRDGEEYPWRLNYSRLDCLSSVNSLLQEKVIRIIDGVPVASEEDEEIRQSSVAPISLQEDEQGVEETRRSFAAPITLHEDEQGVVRIRVKEEHAREVVRKDEAEGDVQGLMRKSVATSTMADKQQQQTMEMFCLCGTAMARKGVKSEYVVPELTHLECMNADGSSYLQIVDSDSEIA